MLGILLVLCVQVNCYGYEAEKNRPPILRDHIVAIQSTKCLQNATYKSLKNICQ